MIVLAKDLRQEKKGPTKREKNIWLGTNINRWRWSKKKRKMGGPLKTEGMIKVRYRRGTVGANWCEMETWENKEGDPKLSQDGGVCLGSEKV